MNKLKIMLVEDFQTVRDGIRLLLDSEADIEIVSEVDNGALAIAQVREVSPDIIVMDISMPELNGLKATQRIKKINSDIKIIILTRHKDTAYLQQLINAGVSGYVLKQSSSTELVQAIRAVSKGNSYIDPALTDKVFGGYTRKSTPLRGELNAELTERESEVLRQIAWGYSNKEIAHSLDLSVKTIEAHKANAMKKMNFFSRIDIVRYAMLQGWLEEN